MPKKIIERREMRAAYSRAFRARLKRWMDGEGLSSSVLANRLGKQVSKDTIANARKRGFPPYEVLILMAERAGANLQWLLTGEGEMVSDEVPISAKGNRIYVPLLGGLQDLLAVRNGPAADARHFVAVSTDMVHTDQTTVVVRVPDGLMHPILGEGWLVGVETSSNAKKASLQSGKIVVALLPDGTAGIRWLDSALGAYRLLTQKEFYVSEAGKPPMDPQPPQILGKVIWWVGKQG